MRMTVNRVAKQSSVTADTVRHYVRIGLLQPRRDPGNHYKLFSESDVRRVDFIHTARQLGYTLREIGAMVRAPQGGEVSRRRVRDIIKGRITTHRQRLDKLYRLQGRLEDALTAWGRLPNGVPSSHGMKKLLESVDDEP